MATGILLIRHGETGSNAARIVQTPDTPLSPRGRDQTRRLALRLAAEGGLTRLVSSDLARAHETAMAISAATGLPVELEPLLQERNFGTFRGTPYAELRVDLFAAEFEPPEGEDGAAFGRRVDRAWARVCELAAATPGRIAIVTHGLVCDELARRHLACGEHSAPAAWGNTCVTVVEGAPPWRVQRLACTAHLDDDSTDGGRV
jgi:2,3-bisphosphoglycerate-dependent phosphoglycerate mutase